MPPQVCFGVAGVGTCMRLGCACVWDVRESTRRWGGELVPSSVLNMQCCAHATELARCTLFGAWTSSACVHSAQTAQARVAHQSCPSQASYEGWPLFWCTHTATAPLSACVPATQRPHAGDAAPAHPDLVARTPMFLWYTSMLRTHAHRPPARAALRA